jgi:CheY-like chemotaxis protein
VIRTKGKILIVDDDPIALEVARERLEDAGYTVVTRESALGTSSAILNERPDLVLLDVNMPALKGDSLAHLLRETVRQTGTRVVLYSASSRASLIDLARECGAAGAVQKSGDAAAFLREIEQFLAPVSSRRRGLALL